MVLMLLVAWMVYDDVKSLVTTSRCSAIYDHDYSYGMYYSYGLIYARSLQLLVQLRLRQQQLPQLRQQAPTAVFGAAPTVATAPTAATRRSSTVAVAPST